MSELRVDNIVSADGTAAPVYSQGLNIPSGKTLTNNGNFVVGGATSIAGVTTFSGASTFSSGANITGNITVTGGLSVIGSGNFNTTGVGTFGTLNVTGSTSFNNITGTISNLVVGAGASIVGIVTAEAFKGNGSQLTGLPAGFDWRDGSLF